MSISLTLDALYEAAFLTDGDSKILDCNVRAVEVLRAKSREDLIGRILADIPSDNVPGADFPTYFRERLTAVPFVVIELRATRDDGTAFWAETVAHRLPSGEHLITLRDVTARVESLHRAEEANERLRAAIRDRMEFVSNVSHELRTPLTSMSYALTNMLRGICGTLPEKAVGYLERLHVDVKRLMTTVNDLLDLRQMENGTLKLHCTRLPLTHLLSEVVRALMIQAEMKQQTLTVDASDQAFYIHADHHKIERVFFNILSNAIKYTPEGGTIVARIYAQDERVLVEVDDNGIGIPPEALPRVSQRYFRVGEQVAGTGLGLSIVREITELHNGTFQVQSPVPGTASGTRITVAFPQAMPPLMTIVSHNSDFITRLTESLAPMSRTNSISLKQLQGPPAANTESPARFIFDGDLPEAELCATICMLRRDPHSSRTPILLLTHAMGPHLKRECARWRIDVRPTAISTADLRALINHQEAL